jgi:hypothetical protein
MIQYKIIIALVAFIAFVAAIFGFGQHQYKKGVEVTTLQYETALSKQKLEASALLASLTAGVHLTEQKLQDLKNQQELKDAKNQKTIAALTALRTSVVLRDPNSTGCGEGSGVTKGKTLGTSGLSAADKASAIGVLSPELTDLLWTKFGEADVISNAYTSCRSDLYNKVEELGK